MAASCDKVTPVIKAWVAHGHEGKCSDPKMPRHPEFVYRKQGVWKGWSHFLGINSTHRCFHKFAARDALEDEAWACYCKTYDLFPDGQSVHDFLAEMYSKDPDAADGKMRGVSWWPEWKRERDHDAARSQEDGSVLSPTEVAAGGGLAFVDERAAKRARTQ